VSTAPSDKGQWRKEGKKRIREEGYPSGAVYERENVKKGFSQRQRNADTGRGEWK
jgi:hypothetical protein